MRKIRQDKSRGHPTSDSFNKLDEGDSSAGEIILEKFVMDFLLKG